MPIQDSNERARNIAEEQCRINEELRKATGQENRIVVPPEMRDFMLYHEADIYYGINDFGELLGTFKGVFGRNPGHCGVGKDARNEAD